MRPTTIMSLIAGFLIALAGIFTALFLISDRYRNYFWFFWAAPLLLVVFALMMLNLARQYWVRVGRLEVKGRPRRG